MYQLERRLTHIAGTRNRKVDDARRQQRSKEASLTHPYCVPGITIPYYLA